MKQVPTSHLSPTAGDFLVPLNAKYHFIDEQQEQRFNVRRMFELLPGAVADLRTLRAAEIYNLFKAINNTVSRVGASRLFLSLMRPSYSLAQIQARQQSIRELRENPDLHRAMVSFLAEFSTLEDNLFLFLNAHTTPLIAYRDFRGAVRAIEAMLAAVSALPRPQSPYLAGLCGTILELQKAPLRDLLVGPVFRTFFGIKSRREKTILTPSWSFRPRHLDVGSLWPALPGMYFGAAWLFGAMEPAMAKTLFLGTSWLVALGLAYGWLLKPVVDFDTAILPIRQRLLESSAFISAIEAVALLDELASFVRFMDIIPHPVVLPEVSDAAAHRFVAKDLRNPIIALTDAGFVANDVDLAEQRITFITGPNSGGKTTYCKTIVQNQILAQIGAPVVASEASITIADRIIYQAPNFDSLADEEGRFGTELKTTRDIFYSVTPKSLAILDEIAEGTTTHEKLSFSTDIMHGFNTIGNSTLLVTHSYELVDYFRQQGKGSFLKMSVEGDCPSHKIAVGISRDSNAERVAEKIGFSRQDIKDYLRKKGYLRP